ncbi:hypothetical protein [Microbacterium sp. 179-I 3D4 NHS]|uniref:hypothetical protein n=1 Tax=Microbacterium sp. 179-I 3D4 NHS TaxID=3142381 RepID=UPI0039A31392
MTDTRTTVTMPQPFATPRITSTREVLVRAADQLWRVQDKASGRVLGHLRTRVEPLGLRYRAERLQLATGAFRLIGEFWGPDDAVSALRHS